MTDTALVLQCVVIGLVDCDMIHTFGDTSSTAQRGLFEILSPIFHFYSRLALVGVLPVLHLHQCNGFKIKVAENRSKHNL